MIVVDATQPRPYEWWSICSSSNSGSSGGSNNSSNSGGGTSQFRLVVVGELEGKKDGMKNGSGKTRNREGRKR